MKETSEQLKLGNTNEDINGCFMLGKTEYHTCSLMSVYGTQRQFDTSHITVITWVFKNKWIIDAITGLEEETYFQIMDDFLNFFKTSLF